MPLPWWFTGTWGYPSTRSRFISSSHEPLFSAENSWVQELEVQREFSAVLSWVLSWHSWHKRSSLVLKAHWWALRCSGIVTGCPERMCSLHPWRFASLKWIKPGGISLPALFPIWTVWWVCDYFYGFVTCCTSPERWRRRFSIQTCSGFTLQMLWPLWKCQKEFSSIIRDAQLLNRNSAYFPWRILCWDMVSFVFFFPFLPMWIMCSILGPEVCPVALIFHMNFWS